MRITDRSTSGRSTSGRSTSGRSTSARNSTFLFGAALFAAGLAVAVPAHAQNATNNSSSAMARSASEPLSSQDKEFMTKAGAANMAEVQMGELAMKKGSTAATREFGRWMVTDHGMAGREMALVARRMDASAATPELTAEQKDQYQKLEGLSGDQFDDAYIKDMVQSHKMALQIFDQEADSGHNLLVKGFARNMVPVLHQHLAEAEDLAKS